MERKILMKKKFLSLLLSVLMIVSVSPIQAATPPAAAHTMPSEMTNTNQADGVTLIKKADIQADGTVNVTIDAYTTSEVRPVMTSIPTDIVLVLDMSGSMNTTVASSKWTYSAVNGGRQRSWGSNYYYGYFNTGSSSRKYYINLGTSASPDYREVTLVDDDQNRNYYYRYYDNTDTAVYVYPKLEDAYEQQVNRQYSYSVEQFYIGETDSASTVYAIDALKTAVKAFIETTHEKNGEIIAAGGTELHRISLVKFATNGYANSNLLTEGNSFNSNNYNYSQLVKNLTPVDSTGAATLTSLVDQLSPGGATAVDYGLRIAGAVLAESNTQSTTRNKVVIVFTDGTPTYNNGFETSVANSAIGTAQGLKFSNTKVYAISMAEGSDPDNTTSNINKFMHYVSSNYPNATSMTSAGTGNASAGYYKSPSQNESLTAIFESIAMDIEAPVISLDAATTQLVDTVSPYFNIPDGVNDITVQTADRIYDATEGWGWAAPVPANGVTLHVSGKTVQVQGFSFDDNYISETPRTKGSNTEYYGTKLVLTINETPDYNTIDALASTFTDGYIPTNDGDANLMKPTGVVASVATPYVLARTVTYQYTDPLTNQPVTYKYFYRFSGANQTVLTDAPAFPGYTFSGWTVSTPAALPIDAAGNYTMPDEDVVFVGSYTANEHTVSYRITGYNPGATVPASHIAAYGTNVAIAADPAPITGYTFSGWFADNPIVGSEDTSFVMPDKDVELYGYFLPNDDTPYQTIHYTQEIDGTYTQALAPIPATGTTGETVTAAVRIFNGFTRDDTVTGATINGETGTFDAKVSGVLAADGSLILRVFHTRNKYTVTYAYDGDVPAGVPALPVDSTVYYHGQTVTVKDHVAQDNFPDHNFVGWHTSDNSVTDTDTTFTMPMSNVTLYGEFSLKTDIPYTVEHWLQNSYGGTAYTKSDVIDTGYGDAGKVIHASTYVRTGFTGYTFDHAAPTSITLTETGEMVLRLYYNLNAYNVTYVVEGGELVFTVPADYNETNVPYNSTVPVKPDLTVPGYTFTGWSVKSPSGTVIDSTTNSFTMPAADVVLTGHFHANTNTKYRIEYYWQKVDGSGYELHEGHDRTGTTGHTATIPELTYPGFTLNDTVTGTRKSGIIAGDGSLVLKLFYDRNVYTVQYAYDGTVPAGAPGVPVDSNTYRYGEEVTVLPDASLINYDFVGWYSKVSGAVTPDTAVFVMPIPQNGSYVTLYGAFYNAADVHYTVKHFLEDPNNLGTYIAVPYQTVRLTGTANTQITEAQITAMQLQNLTGYAYNTYTANNNRIILQAPELVINLYYNLIPYTVTYKIEDPNPGVTVPASYNTTEYYGTTVDVQDDLSLVGYTFSGWEIDTPASVIIDTAADTFTMPAENVVVTGFFTANTNVHFKVEHYWQNIADDNYTLYETIPYYSGITGQTIDVTTPTYAHMIQSYAGLTFNGSAPQSKLSGIVAGDGSLVLRLYYDRNNYTVTYTYEDTAVVKPASDLPAVNPQTYRYGETVIVAPDASEAHYRFIGWYNKIGSVNVTDATASFIMPAENIVLYGDFHYIEGVDYRVQYYLQDSVGSSSYTLKDETLFSDGVAGETANAMVKRFTGYTENTAHADRKASGVITADGKLVLKLFYDLVSYKVTYVIDGTNFSTTDPATLSHTAVYNEVVSIAGDLSAAGYTFHGWTSTDPAIAADQADFTMPAQDVVLVGSFSQYPEYIVEYWLQSKADLTQYVQDTVNSHSHRAPAGTVITPDDIHIREYAGYVYDSSISTVNGTVTETPTLVLKLYYNLVPYTVSYVYEGTVPQGAPALPAAAAWYAGDTVTAETVALSGYTFVGWNSDQLSAAAAPGANFTMPAKDVVLRGKFTANAADYIVEHYLMNDSGNYDNVVPYTETKTGLVGDNVRAGVYQPYLDLGAVLDTAKIQAVGMYTGTVSATSTLVLKLYYSREPAIMVVYHYENDLTQAEWQAMGWPDLPQDTNLYYVGAAVTAKGFTSVAPNLVFEGWYSHDPAFQVAPNGTFTVPRLDAAPGTVPTVHLYGRWIDTTPPSYNIYYYVDNVLHWQGSLAEGLQHTILADPYVDPNYVFTGWSEPQTASGATLPLQTAADGSLYFTMPAEDVIIHGYTSYMPPVTDGTVKIFKVVDAPAGFNGSNTYTFHIYQLENNVKQPIRTVHVTVDPATGRGASDKIVLPIGDNYIIEEADANVPGYTLETVTVDKSGAVMAPGQTFSVIVKLNETEITFTNTYEEIPLEIHDHFGYIIGYPDGLVRPEGSITRAEVATIFFRLLTDAKRAECWSQTNSFTDVPADAWYNNAISTLAKAGVLEGYEDGTFRPDNAITRAELVKIAMSFYGTFDGIADAFTDVGSHWASAFINAAAELGFVNGYGDGTFQPDRQVSRAEAMKIINRTLGRSPEKNHLHQSMIRWEDNADTTAWYYAEVQEATNSHTYISGVSHEIWQAILPIRDWEELEKTWSNANSGKK